MTRIDVPIHPGFETIVGYTGDKQTIAISWHNTKDTLHINDGFSTQSGNGWAYLIWVGHPSVREKLASISEHMLLLFDRETRALSAATPTEATEALAGNKELGKAPSAGGTWVDAQKMLAGFMAWMDSAQVVTA